MNKNRIKPNTLKKFTPSRLVPFPRSFGLPAILLKLDEEHSSYGQEDKTIGDATIPESRQLDAPTSGGFDRLAKVLLDR